MPEPISATVAFVTAAYSSAVAATATVLGAMGTVGALGMGGTYALAGAIVKGGIMMGLSAASAALLRPDVPSSGTTLDFKPDPKAPIRGAMGYTALGGNKVFQATWGYKKVAMSLGVALSLGPIDQVPRFEADGATVTFSGPQNEATGFYAADMWQRTTLGLPGDAALLPPTGLKYGNPGLTGWGTQHAAPQTAFSFWTMVLAKNPEDRDVFTNGVPDPRWIGRWMKLWDPRKDSTYPGGSGPQRRDDWRTWEWSESPYVHALAWCRGHYKLNLDGTIDRTKRIAGIGAPDAAIDIPAFVEGMNIAQANAWTISGEWSTSDGKFQTLLAMLQAGGGEPISRGAQISVMVNAPRVATYTYTRDDLIGQAEIRPLTPRRERKNTIIPRYKSEANGWQYVPAGEVTSSVYRDEDRGEPRSLEIEYTHVRSAKQAGQLAAYDLANLREGLTATLPSKVHLMHVHPGDCITVDVPELALAGQKFVVRRATMNHQAARVTLELRSESDGKHAWALGQAAQPAPSPSLSAVDPKYVPPPAPGDWTVVPKPPGGGGISQPIVIIELPIETTDIVAVIIKHGPSAAGPWTDGYEGSPRPDGRYEIAGLTPGQTYCFSLQYVAKNGAKSDPDIKCGIVAGDLIAGDTTHLNGEPVQTILDKLTNTATLADQNRRAVEALEEVYGDTASAAQSAAAAAASEAAANQAKADAIIAKGEAQASATTAAQKAIDAAGSAAAALTSKNDAEAAQTAAEAAQADAVAKALAAAGSATAASGHATTASQKADAAAGSASAAAGSATVATTKAGEASVSASKAATSETNAEGSKTAAATSATAAAASRDAAAGSATAAATSASTAGTHATNAGTAATAANTAKTAAETARGQAQTAATNAATSETNAAGSAADASSSASTAAQSQGAAAGSATAAAGSASTAATKATEAGNSATAANAAKVAAESARDTADQKATAAASSASAAATSSTQAGQSASAAQTAKTAAETARAGAETAQSSAANSATTATGAAATATTQAGIATTAKNDAQAASSAAITARNQASSFADAAGVSAAASQASAVTATTAKNDALSSAIASLPEIITPELWTVWRSDGPPSARPDLSASWVNAQGEFIDFNLAGPKQHLPWETGKIIELVSRVRNPHAQAVNYRHVGSRFTSDFIHIDWNSTGEQVSIPAGETVTVTSRFSMGVSVPGAFPFDFKPNTAWVGVAVRNNLTPGLPLAISSLVVRDVTSQYGAEAAATAAATSASSAAASETAAGQSASAASTAKTQAETARGQAQTAATQAASSRDDAAGSAASASASATLAANSRDAAAGSASAAAGSASTATTKAGEAGTHAAAALASQVAASTARDEALQALMQQGRTNLVARENVTNQSQVVPVSPSTAGWGFTLTGTGTSQAREIIVGPLKQSTPYSVSFKARRSIGTGASSLNVDLYPDTLPERVFQIDENWTDFKWEGLTSSHPDMTLPNVRLRFFRSPLASGVQFEVTDIKLEEGATATAWTPSPKDAPASAQAAATSASSASASETAAGASATSASGSATTANTAAGQAQTYSNQASSSATAAAGSATTASQASGTAVSARDAAIGARNDAQGAAATAIAQASSASASAASAQISADLAASVGAVRPNLLKNGGLEDGSVGMSGSGPLVVSDDPSWGRNIKNAATTSGTHSIVWPAISVRGNARYTISGDTGFFHTGSGGYSYLDLIFYRADGTQALDGPQKNINGLHDFSNAKERLQAHAVSVVAPADAVTAVARAIFSNMNAPTFMGARRVKVEEGDLPATAFTSEASANQIAGRLAIVAEVAADAAEQIGSARFRVTGDGGAEPFDISLEAGPDGSSASLTAKAIRLRNIVNGQAINVVEVVGGKARFSGDVEIDGDLLLSGTINGRRVIIPDTVTPMAATYAAGSVGLNGTTETQVQEVWVTTQGGPVVVDFNGLINMRHDPSGSFGAVMEVRRSPNAGTGIQMLYMSVPALGGGNDSVMGMYPLKLIDRPAAGTWRYFVTVRSTVDNMSIQEVRQRFMSALEYRTNS